MATKKQQYERLKQLKEWRDNCFCGSRRICPHGCKNKSRGRKILKEMFNTRYRTKQAKKLRAWDAKLKKQGKTRIGRWVMAL